MRSIFASGEIAQKLREKKQDKLYVYSFFPNDRGDCVCQDMIRKWKDRLLETHPKNREDEMAKVDHLECPRDKAGMKRYKITCKNCGEVQGFVWATDKTLSDFCDFHYVNWTDGEKWYGCLTPNVSPIDQYLGLECTCGQDTRDFRANKTLSGKVAEDIEESNRRGRRFGQSDSKFRVVLA